MNGKGSDNNRISDWNKYRSNFDDIFKKKELKTSALWLHTDEFKKYRINDPTGWPDSEYFNTSKITKEEFLNRLLKSKIYEVTD